MSPFAVRKASLFSTGWFLGGFGVETMKQGQGLLGLCNRPVSAFFTCAALFLSYKFFPKYLSVVSKVTSLFFGMQVSYMHHLFRQKSAVRFLERHLNLQDKTDRTGDEWRKAENNRFRIDSLSDNYFVCTMKYRNRILFANVPKKQRKVFQTKLEKNRFVRVEM